MAATRPVPAEFWAQLGAAGRRCLLLDYDGTLAPFTPERDRAVPYAGVAALLAKMLAARHTRIVIISGRKAHDIPPLLNIRPHPEIWGSHGLERLRPNGTYAIPELPADIQTALASARRLAVAGTNPARLEEKPGCLALHWRGLADEDVRTLRTAVEPAWRELAQRSRLVLRGFDGGIELRSELFTKGSAVATVLAEAGADCRAAYLGDDLTDEDAFCALGERGLGVLVRTEYRETRAAAWLNPPEELLEFLAQWHRVGQTAQAGQVAKE